MYIIVVIMHSQFILFVFGFKFWDFTFSLIASSHWTSCGSSELTRVVILSPRMRSLTVNNCKGFDQFEVVWAPQSDGLCMMISWRSDHRKEWESWKRLLFFPLRIVLLRIVKDGSNLFLPWVMSNSTLSTVDYFRL